MSAHTPGPWSEEIISDSGGGDRWQVVAETERVCVLSRNEHARSNAKIIAAAPMLLDGLKIAVARLARVDGGDTMVVSTLLDVIHDATGEAFDHEAFIADEDAKAEGKP